MLKSRLGLYLFVPRTREISQKKYTRNVFETKLLVHIGWTGPRD